MQKNPKNKEKGFTIMTWNNLVVSDEISVSRKEIGLFHWKLQTGQMKKKKRELLEAWG